MEWLIVIILYSLLALIGLLGNTWVITTVLNQLLFAGGYAGSTTRRHQHQRAAQRSAFLYLLLLSIVDLISIGAVPLIAADIAKSRWPFGLAACRLLFTCEGANKSLSPLVLMAMSVDRYVAVCRSSRHRLREWRVAALIAAGCIAISLLFILPVTLQASVTSLLDSDDEEHVKCTVMMTPLFDFLHTVVCFIVPLSAICGVYTAILRRLYRHKAEMRQKATRSTIPISRVVTSSVMVIAFYFICWTPYWAHRMVNMATKSRGEPDSRSLEIMPLNPLALPPDQTSMLESMFGAQLAPTTSDGPMNLSSVLGEMDIIQLISLHDELIRREKASRSRARHAPFQQLPPGPQGRGPYQRSVMLEMYLLHALPYCQCALNWLFYAFLNRNLRQQGSGSDKKQPKQSQPSVRFRGAVVKNGTIRRQSEPMLVVVPEDTEPADSGGSTIGPVGSRKQSRMTTHLAPCVRKISRSTENLRLAVARSPTESTDISGDEHRSGAPATAPVGDYNPLSPLRALLLQPTRTTENTPSVSLQSGSVYWL